MPSGQFSKLTWLKRTDGHKFTGAEFRVLIAVFNHTSADGRNAHPGLKRLVEETGYRKSGVSEAITSLRARGWIRETRRGSGYTGNASVYELVPDAPNALRSSAVAEPPTEPSSSARPEQPSECVPPERTSSSAVAELVVPPERNPSDPGLSDPGSDPDSSDREEVRYPPNHLKDQDETGSEGRSLADAGWDDPFASEPAWRAAAPTPEQRLIAAIRSEGSVGAKSDLGRLMGVSRQEVNEIVPRMIAEGVIVHDTDRAYPALLLA